MTENKALRGPEPDSESSDYPHTTSQLPQEESRYSVLTVPYYNVTSYTIVDSASCEAERKYLQSQYRQMKSKIIKFLVGKNFTISEAEKGFHQLSDKKRKEILIIIRLEKGIKE